MTMRSVFISFLLAALASYVTADCAQSTAPIWRETIGDAESYPFDPDTINIVSQDGESVVFEVNQLWVEEGTPMFAVHYRSLAEGEEVCDMDALEDEVIPYESSQTYTAECVHGFAEISVYVYVGENDAFVPEECEACQAPDDNYVGYYVTVPCTYDPECEPSATPTGVPTAAPTGVPTGTPTSSPTGEPTEDPTASPTGEPTEDPTASPTGEPTEDPTASPTG